MSCLAPIALEAGALYAGSVRAQELKAKNKLNYKLFSDATAEAMKQFGVAFRLDDATFAKYRDNYNVDLEKLSGQGHHILPVPSVFVVDKAGKITFVYSNPDYKVRLSGTELLKALDKN